MLALLVAACTSVTTTLEPQTKARDARLARIYLIRDKSWVSGAAAKVKVDDVEVGAVAADSFMLVDRPPGKHVVSLGSALGLGWADYEIEAAAGQTRYYSVELRDTIAVAPPLVVPIVYPTHGRVLPEKGPSFNAAFRLAEMTSADAAALMAKLRSPEAAR